MNYRIAPYITNFSIFYVSIHWKLYRPGSRMEYASQTDGITNEAYTRVREALEAHHLHDTQHLN
jgi:hypothetical protein